MLLTLNRTQKTALGLLRTNVAYDFNMSDARHKAVAETLLERRFAEKTSKKDLAAQAGDLAARQAAAAADGGGIAPALLEQMVIAGQEALEAEQKAEAAKQAGAAAAKAKAGAAK